MNCPKCKSDTKVKETISDVNAVYRRRECKECGFIFHTVEWAPSLVKKDKTSVQEIDPANELSKLRSKKYYKKKEKNK